MLFVQMFYSLFAYIFLEMDIPGKVLFSFNGRQILIRSGVRYGIYNYGKFEMRIHGIRLL